MLRTKPLEIRPSGLRIVSMVSHGDVTIYLTAIKSFYKQINEGEIVIMDDGSLSEQDRRLLSYHLGSPEFIDVKTVDPGPFPRGGCWERLLTILDIAKQFYVVQLDSDTLTRSAIPEVLDCIRANACFTLGTRSGQRFVTLTKASAYAERLGGCHVQLAAERNLLRLPDPSIRRYVRGSAGFAGFAKGVHLREKAGLFSQHMFERLGQKWTEWGSEQVTSNYLVANSPRAVVLPYPKYTCFRPEENLNSAAFIHFIGTHRYSGGVYGKESRAVIRRTLASAAAVKPVT